MHTRRNPLLFAVRAVFLVLALRLGGAPAAGQGLSVVLQPRGIRSVADTAFVVRGAPYDGIATVADVYVLYAKSNPSHSIRRPLVVVEGFSPRFFWQMGGEMPSQVEVMRDFPAVFVDYDLVYVAWRDAQQPIEANTQTLVALLSHLSASERGVIVGHSMGGLIARIALVWMERSHQSHGMDYYVSYDTPHRGAYWPLGVMYGVYGVQCFFDQTQDFGSAIIERAPHIVDLIMGVSDSASARQMLMQHLAPDGRLDNADYHSFQNYLDDIGYPHGDPGHPIHMMAVANAPMGDFTPPEEYVRVRFEGQTDLMGLLNGVWNVGNMLSVGSRLHSLRAALLSSIPGRTILEGELICLPAHKSGTVITRLDIYLTKELYWLKPVRLKIFEYQARQPALGVYPDYCPYSTISFGALDVHSLTENVPIFDNIRYHIRSSESAPFVPVASALAVAGRNMTAFTTLPTPEQTPFGAEIYLTEHQNRHIVFDPAAIRWIHSRCQK